MLQIRVTDPDGSNPVILESTQGRRYFKTLNSSDEGISFKVAKNHSKAEILNPDSGGYAKFWEVWDTETNQRLNYGPISSIDEDGPDWSIAGAGRSALLNDYIDTKKTFYAPIDGFIDNLRFENIAIEPRTSTLVHDAVVTSGQTIVFGTVNINEKYQGISKTSKDNVIDNQTSLRPGEIEPPNTYYTVESFWAGQSTNDSIIVDLGEVFPIAKVIVATPSWGGLVRRGNRSYDFSVAYANDTEATITTLKGRDFGPFHQLYDTGNDSSKQGYFTYYLGTTYSGVHITPYEYVDYIALDQAGPVDMRYLRVNIRDVHAWEGTSGITSITDNWAYQCDSTYSGGASEDIEISDRTLKPNNNCYASLLEIGTYKEVFKRDTIKPLALQRIDNDNLQIKYYHVPDASETTTTSAGLRQFEPGGFFRKIKVTYSGASTAYTQFFASDCANCYPDSFNFGISDQNNTLIYASDSSSGTNVVINAPAYTRNILIKGASNVVVTEADAWLSKYDPLSWGSAYSYTTVANDYAVLRFRGQSFRWYATIPSDETGANVKIEIRNKNSSGTWTGWTTLEASYALPNDISSEIVYEITYESGTLLAETIYEIKITNLDGGYCAIDSFEGYWSASMTTYNDDSSRTFHSKPEYMTQIYDSRFNAGSAVKWNQPAFMQGTFEGDRVVLLSAKGRNHGTITLFLFEGSNAHPAYDNEPQIVDIPGGEANGSLRINLDTGKRGAEIPQYIMFDSDDYFTSGLPWKKYYWKAYLLSSDLQTYSANIYDTNNFVARCQDCKTPKGTSTINKYVYLDSWIVHEKVGLSVSFETQTHLEMLKSVADAIQVEWDITENGIRFEPRVGTDTNIILREGQNTVVDYKIVNDISKVSSMLFSSGADIDGLPLTTVTEDRKNRNTLGRTVMRKEDFRSMASYTQLIGLSRTELRKRRYPEKRITVSHISHNLDLNEGDTFILYTKKMGSLRVRIVRKEIEETQGRVYNLECIKWPLI